MLSAAAVVMCALDILGRSHALVPIEVMPNPPYNASRNAEAFLSREQQRIYLIAASSAFVAAQRGNDGFGSRAGCVKLASIIVHEEWHLRNGSDERGAYLAQLTLLAALGANPAMISSVRQSMVVAVERQRRRQRVQADDSCEPPLCLAELDEQSSLSAAQ